MSKGYNFLDQISDDKETWRIRVRIPRMWKVVNKRSGNNLISLDMIIFIDEKVIILHNNEMFESFELFYFIIIVKMKTLKALIKKKVSTTNHIIDH